MIDSEYQTFWGHVEHLRSVILKSFSVIALGVILSLFFYQEIFQIIKSPIDTSALKHFTVKTEEIVNTSHQAVTFKLPKNAKATSLSPNTLKLDETTYQIPPSETLTLEQKQEASNLFIFGPIDGMTMTLKVCFFVGLFATSPLWLFFILQFIAPAFEQTYHHLILPFLLSSLTFIALGMSFAYFITIPIANAYLTSFNQDLGVNLWSLSNYLDYTLLLLIGNGLSFEMSVIAVFLVHYGLLTANHLIAARRYFIVAAFILSAILTPPDVLTQVMLAIPLIILYEFIIIYAKFLAKKTTATQSHCLADL